jgi:hypothetical protein
MAKPMRPVELITTVRRLIGRRDAQPATTALALR